MTVPLLVPFTPFVLPWGLLSLLRCATTMQLSSWWPCFLTLSAASSQIFFKRSNFSPLHTPSAVIRTLALESRIRSANESDEYPANYDHIYSTLVFFSPTDFYDHHPLAFIILLSAFIILTTTLWTAPILVQANMAIGSSKIIGM